jgi:hypothetical protein
MKIMMEKSRDLETIRISPSLSLRAYAVPYGYSCEGCYLDRFASCINIKFRHDAFCSPEVRPDGLNVIFKKVDL